MNKIRKVIIPVAGMGTRFLPATKAQPKEMLPVVDKPTIQYIVEGAVKAGITDVILVTGATKRAIEDHFDKNTDLENKLQKAGKKKYAEEIKKVAEMANFIYIRQKSPYGNGSPVKDAAHVVGNEAFAVLFGDDIWECPTKPHLKQLIEVYEKYGDPVISIIETDDAGTYKHGIVEGPEVEKDVYQIKKLIEKPGPKKTKSRLASVSGYILTPDIFDELNKLKKGKGGEIWLVDAINNLSKKRPIYAKIIKGKYHDTGNKLTWLKANIDFGLKDPEIKNELKKYIKSIK